MDFIVLYGITLNCILISYRFLLILLLYCIVLYTYLKYIYPIKKCFQLRQTNLQFVLILRVKIRYKCV